MKFARDKAPCGSGHYFVATVALAQAQQLSSLLDLQEISGLAAQTQRLVVLMDVMDEIQRDAEAKPSDEPSSRIVHLQSLPPVALQLEGLTFLTPGNRSLICSDQDLTMLQGVVSHFTPRN